MDIGNKSSFFKALASASSAGTSFSSTDLVVKLPLPKMEFKSGIISLFSSELNDNLAENLPEALSKTGTNCCIVSI